MARLKKRLDVRLLEEHPELTRAQAQGWIIRGHVMVDGVPVTKSGTIVYDESSIELRLPDTRFVSRAGYKLEAALSTFAIDVTNKVALDAGISTGGFTHCLLQRGIQRVYGIDVGYGQVHEAVRSDPRLVLMERTNLRFVTTLPEPIDIITLDLSFISVTKILPNVHALLRDGGELVILIKPQFEAGYEEVSRGAGIITDPAIHEQVVTEVTRAIVFAGFIVHGTIPSPLMGGSGNKEFLLYAHKSPLVPTEVREEKLT